MRPRRSRRAAVAKVVRARATSRAHVRVRAQRGGCQVRGSWRRRATAGLVALVTLVPVLAGCTGDSSDPEVGPTKPVSEKPVVLTFGVYSPQEALTAFRSTVTVWNATTDGPEVKLHTWES